MEYTELLDRIVELVAIRCGTTPEALRRRGSLTRPVTDARHLVMLIAIEQGEYPKHVAAYFNRRPQSVHYAVGNARKLIGQNKTIKRLYENVCEQLRADDDL